MLTSRSTHDHRLANARLQVSQRPKAGGFGVFSPKILKKPLFSKPLRPAYSPRLAWSPPFAFAFGARLKVSSTATFPLGRSMATPAMSCSIVRSWMRGNFAPLNALV